MSEPLRIGTRDSELAVWQATLVQDMMASFGTKTELVFIKSEGDLDLQTPLYEMGVQGIFTKSLDLALIQNRIDIAVHSMKDVPTMLAKGLTQAAVLKRGSYKDIFVPGSNLNNTQELFLSSLEDFGKVGSEDEIIIATSSIRRRAQWLHKFPTHSIENIRGNVNTRLKKTAESNWAGAIFAAAGLERINKKPANSIDLDWMLPAPAQGAVVVITRFDDGLTTKLAAQLNDSVTALCTKIEKDFLRILKGGCSTPISALAETDGKELYAVASILSPDGKQKAGIQKLLPIDDATNLGIILAEEILDKGGREIVELLRLEKTLDI